MDLNCSLHPLSLLFCVVFLVSSVHGFSTVHKDVFHSSRGLDQDAQALVEIRRALSVNSAVLSDWSLSENPCGWSGVECGEVIATDGVTVEERVVRLELDSKQLEGSLSPAIGWLSELKRLSLAHNMLVGNIPKGISGCLKLEYLDLRGNKLSGPIPSELSLRRLKDLHLSDNHFSGELSFLVPNTVSDRLQFPFPNLQFLDLANNNFSGMIPSDIARISALESIFLNGNMLVGSIPKSLGSLQSLLVLHLHGNFLQGELPPALADDGSKLQSLDVSSNFLVGRIPPSFSKVRTLRFLNVSNNNLEGPIPWGAWFRYGADPSAFVGNAGLCGRPLKSCSTKTATEYSTSQSSEQQQQQQSQHKFLSWIVGMLWHKSSHSAALKNRVMFMEYNESEVLLQSRAPAPAPGPSHHRNENVTDAEAPAPESQRRKHGKLSPKKRWAFGMIVGIVMGAISAFVFSFLFRMFLFYIRERPKVQGAVIYSPLIKKTEDLAFLETEDGLMSGEPIGRGGSGEVYRAQLPYGKEIAIKRIHQATPNPADVTEEDTKLLDRRRRQIRSELETLGHIRHRNLVALLAYVARSDCHLLVYEYMKNGSLQQALTRVREGTLELPWPTRHKIALGIASGLQYLHYNSAPKIIHRDLKPGNILLDEDFEARIADFGLAKALADTATHASSSNVAGTVGYIAPEYHQTLKFTTKCDVYSFGVVLAFLVTGKEPSNDFFQEISQASVPLWLRTIVNSETASQAIDPSLIGQGYEDQMLLVLKIACFCTDDDPRKRPTSRDVLTMLTQINNGG